MRRPIAALVAAGAVLAACTTSSGVDSTARDPIPATDDGPADTGGPDDTSAPDRTTPTGDGPLVTPPDPSGLPTLDDDPTIVTGTLDNGMRYLVRQNDNPGSRVDMRLAIDAGSALQTVDQGGGAHFLEHMLFNGTEEFPENELIAVLRSFGAGFGADVNAYTSYDETVYELTMPTQDPAVVATGLDVLEQWLTSATIDPAQVEAERGVVLDEWRTSAQSANGRVFDAIQAFFLDGSPYENRRPIGTDAEISATTSEPLRAFYDDWYRPDNAAVVVAGDIDPDAIEEQIVERFAPVSARGDSPERPELVVEPADEPRAVVFDDPDLAEGFAFVTLPLARDVGGAVEAVRQREIYDALAFDIIATRLADDALRGDAPFDSASVDDSGFVRLLDAPEIYVSADGADIEASTQAILDEYERVRRFGFTQAEVDRAVGTRRSRAAVEYEGRDSRQDATYADEYVRHVLEDEPIPTASRWFDYVSEVLDRATPENLAYVFLDRYETAGPHVFVAVPSAEAGDVPDAAAFVAQATGVGDRDLEPRAGGTSIGDALLDPPEPVEPTGTSSLADGSVISFVAPEVLEYANGARVVFNRTPITDGVVVFEARSPGGTAALPDDDVADAMIAENVVDDSGVGPFDRVALDAFLADKEVSLDATIDVFAEGMTGTSATADLETLVQLVHLLMTDPRVDPVTLDQFVDDELPLARDPSLDPNYARFRALTEARYDDPRYRLLDVEDLTDVDAAEVRRVFVDRFGDASDWVFSFNGDVDPDRMRELAATYIGTLPGGGPPDDVDVREPATPPGVVVEVARAGQGDQASVTFLFTAPASTDRRDDVAARLVQEVVTARLTDVIREELGESYSPFAAIELSAGGSPVVESLLAISTGPDLVDDVSIAVLDEITALRGEGVTDAEYSSAVATVGNELELFSNEQINDEILAALTDPAGNASFDEFENQGDLLASIDQGDLDDYLDAWLPLDEYVEIRVLPR